MPIVIDAGANGMLDLVKMFPLAPITDNETLRKALVIVRALLDIEFPSEAAVQYRDTLTNLIAEYEAAHIKMGKPSDAELLQELLAMKQVTQAEMAAQTGIAPSTISDVLSGKRTFTRSHIGKVAEYFGVSVDAFCFD